MGKADVERGNEGGLTVVGTWLGVVGLWMWGGVGWDERKNPLSLSGMRERRWEVWFFPLVLSIID